MSSHCRFDAYRLLHNNTLSHVLPVSNETTNAQDGRHNVTLTPDENASFLHVPANFGCVRPS